MKDKKLIKILIIALNIIGIICLIYFMIPYISHDMTIKNPDAMLATYSWDTSGFVLTLGVIPLIIANTLAFIFIKTKHRVLYFIPSIICIVLAGHYLIFATDWREEDQNKPMDTMKCVINKKEYTYRIYKEENGNYSVGFEDNDSIPVAIIDFTDKDSIVKSIEKYYKDNKGMCP